jgi:uncharacterized protein YggE
MHIVAIDMSERTDDNTKRSNSKRQRLAIVAGALVIGLFAAVLAGSQALGPVAAQQSAGAAQTQSSTNETTVPTYYHSKYGMQPGTISTSGMAATKVDPDKFSITVGVETNGTTASNAASSNAILMNQVVTSLKALGIKEDQIATTNFNVYPVYVYGQPSKYCPQIYPQPPYCQPNQVITGYRASNSVTITLDTNGPVDASKVIDTSVGAGANNIFGVSFFVSQGKQEAIKDGLTQQAIANARHHADIAADALGVRVSGIQSVNLNDIYFPIYAKTFNAGEVPTIADMSTPIQAGQQDISTTVSIIFYLSEPGGASSAPTGMTATNGNANCTNPIGGPMVC